MALRVITVVRSLPVSAEGSVLGKQVLRSATSVAANYRAACKARSHKDFIYKLGICEEGADETQLWLELIADSKLMKRSRMESLLKEVSELTAIFAASRITALKKSSKSKISNRQSQIENRQS
jgi:four helix bundle protein